MRFPCLLALGAFTIMSARLARAQETFTRQVILVPVFQGQDRKLADAVADAIRSRVQRASKRNEVSVVNEYMMEGILERASIDRTTSDTFYVKSLAREVRADELIQGSVERVGPRQVRVTARLLLARDNRMLQPIPVVDAPNADSAGAVIAQHVVRVRAQMTSLRRCENAMRDGKPEEAVKLGEAGVAAVPNGVLVRTCTIRAMLAAGAGARDVLMHARRVLETHATSWWALDGAARAHDALKEREEAAAMWRRLAETDTTDLILGRRVVTAMLDGGNAKHAVPLVARLVTQAPDDLELLRLQWQALTATSAWAPAVVVGARLYQDDAEWYGDSSFVWRLALARRSAGDTLRSLSLAAEGVARFPKDSRLYLLYADLVRSDGRTAIARGVERFPDVAELRLLRAQELRTAGKAGEAVVELQRATALDSSSGQGRLALAQAQAELGLLDSAITEARRALVAGADRATVAQFALARGNALYRAANSTRKRADYQVAKDFIALADSVESTPQSQFLLGATALSISQLAATEAPETRACDLSQLASQLLPLAREKITSGARVAPDAARQYLGYLDELEPVVQRQVAALCTAPGRA